MAASNSFKDSNSENEIDNEDSGITMVDVLEEEQELENDADAVLGGSDDKNCTYIEGYVNRQALYACMTCTNNEPAGICLACSYACHEGHDLIELYTKRNFRCDCGNRKFQNNQCQFFKNKSLNENNYNQNFLGKYCICHRPYPDPEDDQPDEMIQCIICEDWYHARHLLTSLPSYDFTELVCKTCMEKNSFLWNYYTPSKVTSLKAEDGGTICIDDVADPTSTSDEKSDSLSKATNGIANKLTLIKAKDHDEMSLKTESINNASVECFYKSLPVNTSMVSSAFWTEGWRNKLCKCKECITLYEKHNCSYLIDPEDTVHAYEERGKVKSSGLTRYDKGLSALNSLGRVQQVEAIHEYNSMKSELKEFLKTFADSKRIVKETDIHDFFNNMQARKRQKTSTQIPHFCR